MTLIFRGQTRWDGGSSSFQPYSYSSETSERCWCDKDQHQQFNLHVEGKDKGKGIV